MTMSDPLGDMLTRIRNGQQARKDVIDAPFSTLHTTVCDVLKGEGYIRGYNVVDVDGKGGKKAMKIELKYNDGVGVIQEISRVSKPGRRVYSKVADMKPFYNGLGVRVMSTPKGVMTDHAAREANVGGEVLFQVF